MRGLVLRPRHNLEHSIKPHRKKMESKGVGQSGVADGSKHNNESSGSTKRTKLYTRLLPFYQAESHSTESVLQTQLGRHMM